jgi:hypothetical protein
VPVVRYRMSREYALLLVARHRDGGHVPEAELMEARVVTARTRERRSLPALSPVFRDRVNWILLDNLALALSRLRGSS